MITVVGEEGTPMDDFTLMLKADFVDAAYLQQNAFDPVDGATPRERQQFVFDKILHVLHLNFGFTGKDQAREVLVRITSLFRDWNYLPWDPAVLSPETGQENKGRVSDFRTMLDEIDHFIQTRGGMANDKADGGTTEDAMHGLQEWEAPGDEAEERRSGLCRSIGSVRTDARPRSKKTLSGDLSDLKGTQEAQDVRNQGRGVSGLSSIRKRADDDAEIL